MALLPSEERMFKYSRSEMQRKKLLWLLIAVVLVIGGGGLYYEFYFRPMHPAYAESPFQQALLQNPATLEWRGAQQSLELKQLNGEWVIPNLGNLPVVPAQINGLRQSLAAAKNLGPHAMGKMEIAEAGLQSADNPSTQQLRLLAEDGAVLADWLFGNITADNKVLARPLDQEVVYALDMVLPPPALLWWVLPGYHDFQPENLTQIRIQNEFGTIDLLISGDPSRQAWRITNMPPDARLRADAPVVKLPGMLSGAKIQSAKPLTDIRPDSALRRRIDLWNQAGRILTLIQAPQQNQYWSFYQTTNAQGQNENPLNPKTMVWQLDDGTNALFALSLATIIEPAGP
jgi:hypothetical protein